MSTEYTDEYLITSSNGEYCLHVSVKPDTDIDDSFHALCNDTGEIISVNGWLWLFERLN